MTLAAGMVGIIARIARSALIDVGQEDFISTAVAKGLSRQPIVRRHLLPNAAIPITTIIGLELGVLMSGTIIVEVIFSWPGVGSLLFQAVNVRDTPLTTGVVVVYTTLFIVTERPDRPVLFPHRSAHRRGRRGAPLNARSFLQVKFIVGALCVGIIVRWRWRASSSPRTIRESRT